MSPHIPWPVTAAVIGTALAIAAAVWLILSNGAARNLPPERRRALRGASAAFLAAWLAAVVLLAPSGSSLAARDPFYLTPLIPFFATVPLALVALALWRSPALRRAVAGIPLSQLVGVQAWRIVGVVFVVLYALGQLPGHFALPAGWGDFAIGITAPVVALALARGARRARPLAAAWIVLGLIDLVVAVGMGTGYLAPLLAPHLGARVPPAGAMGAFPMLLVPAFAVPMSVALHLVALVRLGRVTGAAPRRAAGEVGAR